MEEWQVHAAYYLLLLAVAGSAIVRYIVDMNDRNRLAHKVCTERITGRIDRMATMMVDNGMKMRRRGLRFSYNRNFTFQRNLVYHYSYNGKEYWGIDMRRIISVFSTGRHGDYTTLYCNPNNPQQFYCPGEDWNFRLNRDGVAVMVAVFCVVCVLLTVFF